MFGFLYFAWVEPYSSLPGFLHWQLIVGAFSVWSDLSRKVFACNPNSMRDMKLAL